MNEQPQRKTFFGGCPHDCPDTCAMIYEVEDGKIVEVRGNKEHPMTRGTLCVKLKDYHDHHYNPDRVLHPLRRTGPKGSRQFARQFPTRVAITWPIRRPPPARARRARYGTGPEAPPNAVRSAPPG